MHAYLKSVLPYYQVVAVLFDDRRKPHYYKTSLRVSEDDRVVVLTERGYEVVRVVETEVDVSSLTTRLPKDWIIDAVDLFKVQKDIAIEQGMLNNSEGFGVM